MLTIFHHFLYSESKKRGVADASSQQEVEAAFGGSQKRPRGDPLSAIDDEELLEYAARMPFSQLTQDECQQGSTPPHGSALPARKPGAGALRQQPQAGATDVDEELDIEALLDMEDDAEVAKDAGKEDTRPTDGDQLRQTVDSILPVREYVAPQRDAINIQGDFLTVTSEYGQRVYASVAAAEGPLTSSTRVDIAGALRRVRGGLLSGSIQQLMAEVENDRLERALAESGDRTAIQEPSQGGSAPAKDAAGQSDAKGAPNAALWVDRYSPKGFMDLLSDEQINRDVVRWLKSWDPCVFGRDPPPEPTAPSRGGYSSKKAPATAPTAAYHDDLKRPEHKVILLCGPPGLGKTTLAHVVARHCGYRPVEINASDDRSGSALLSRVTDAAEMRSVVGEKRPNCIIIDEIDGAVGGSEGRSAIAALLKLVTATGKAKGGSAPAKEKAADAAHDDDESDDEEGGADAAGRSGGSGGAKVVHGRAAGGKKKPQLRPLLRPIICICNDLYAPALRPLREVAKVFQFRRPSAERVAHRLQMVCAAEGLRAEKSTLRMLAERAECDVRSCLNTLQFLAKRQRLVRQRDVAGLNLGQKDMTKGAFQVWGELLQKKVRTSPKLNLFTPCLFSYKKTKKIHCSEPA